MPSFNPFANVTGRTSATLFEIRLDDEIIVLRGAENEASSQLLKGVVVLCLPAALKIEDVHLKMIGQLRVGWNDQRNTPSGTSNNRVERTTEIYNHKWAPFVGGHGPGSSSKGTTLVAGNYEWPFELVLPGTMPESIEGLPDSHIVYKLKASVARGKLAYDLHAYKPVRLVRTLDPSALELAHAMTVENVWPNKIEYQLVIPQKAIIFGTAITVEMRFTSLLKGLRIGTIKCVLVETQEYTLPGATVHTERYWKHSRDIDNWTFEINDEEHYHDLLDDSGQDGWRLNQTMPLPKRLSKCMQDVDIHGIKIRHKVKFNIALHNPDGHVSELRATLPVTIFISPNMPIDAEGCLIDQTPTTTTNLNELASNAPPLYGEHVLDQLYADMDLSGLMTPAPQSGMNTPLYNHSRSGSHENLPSMSLDSAISIDTTNNTNTNGAVAPAALSSRLQNLNINAGSRNSSFTRIHHASNGSNTPHHLAHPNTNGYFDLNHSGTPSATNSNPLSRRTSYEDEHSRLPLTSGQHTPEHIDYTDLGDLCKVPSYSTAVRAPIRGLSYSEALPNYETAVSTPTTPSGEPGPLGAHDGRPRVLPPSSLPTGLGDEDERRRLHFLRHRERVH